MHTLDEYFQRIIPVVGNYLRDKTIALFNLPYTFLVAEAFARCGVKRFVFFDDAAVAAGDMFCYTFGEKYVGQNYCDALRDIIMTHNILEKEWEFYVWERPNTSYDPLLRSLNADLIIGAGSVQDICFIEKIAQQVNIPAISFILVKDRDVNSAVFVHNENLPRAFTEFLLTLGHEAMIDTCDLTLERHINWLDACDETMRLAKAVLLRGTQNNVDEIERLLFQERKCVVLKGSARWPWHVSFINPLTSKDYIRKRFTFMRRFVEPLGFFSDKKIMIIGCGTASLLARDIAHYFHSVILVDCKPFSIYNPVRQWVDVSEVENELKPFVLARKLSERIADDKEWVVEEFPHGTIYKNIHTANYFAGINLNLSATNADSITTFEHYLDLFRPDIVVVAMGRSQDDNFAAADALRKKGIKHVIPTAFPGVTHYKAIVVDGKNGPCYECLNSKLPVDFGDAPDLSEEQREMFYGGTQPATVFETCPSVHLTLRLCIELLKPSWLQGAWFRNLIQKERTCLVGGNRATEKNSEWLYGVTVPGQVVAYGVEDIVSYKKSDRCVCGRVNTVKHVIKSDFS